jgi:hypothetical protein
VTSVFVFITAGRIIKLFAWGEGDSGECDTKDYELGGQEFSVPQWGDESSLSGQ